METISFDQFCSNYRRKKIMEAIMPENSQDLLEIDQTSQEMLKAYKLHIKRLKEENISQKPNDKDESNE